MEAYFLTQEDKLETLDRAISTYKKTPKERFTLSYVETKLETLDLLWSSFRKDHAYIVASVKRDDKKKLTYFTDDIYSAFEENYTTYKCRLKEDLQKYSPSTSNSDHQGQALATVGGAEIKLPRLDIPEFHGKYEEWQTFYDLFVALVHDNPSLSKVQKLRYLKSKVLGEAGNILKNLATTNDNYEDAWKQLVRRYNNKRYNSNLILKRLFSQKNITNASAYAIKQLLDVTSSCLQSLENLGIKTDSWDTIIIYLVVTKLDSESHKEWENKISQSEDDELPKWTKLVKFLEARFRTLELLDSKQSSSKPNEKFVAKSKSFHYTVDEDKNKSIVDKSCGLCSEDHYLYQCKQFAKQSPQEKYEYVQSKRLCFNCLSPTHSVKSCHQSTSCRRCGRRHHSLLHQEKLSNQEGARGPPAQEQTIKQTPNNQTNPVAESRQVVTHFSQSDSVDEKVLLATATVRAKSRGGYTHVLRCLLDQGSQASFVTEATVQLLGLKRIPVNCSVSGLADGETRVKNMVSLIVESRHNSDCVLQINAFVLNSLTTLLPSEQVPRSEWLELEGLPLADPNYASPSKINVLLGAEVYGEILLEGLIKHRSGPVAQNTLLGWILSGKVQGESTSAEKRFVNMHVQVKEDQLLKQFWEIENEPDCIQKRLTPEEIRCEELFESTTIRNDSGRYVVRLPFRSEDPECQYGKSREIALRRFRSLESKLIKNPTLYEEYRNVLKEYLELNHMECITEQEEIDNEKAVYLPHHAVVREDKETTKVRVVFDASCKGINNVSLNDDLLIGPKLQQDLRHILMRWRCHPVCFVADLVKMYRQVLTTDTDFQRILWRFSPDEPIRHYKLLTLTFGTACAPYMAVKALQQLAKDNEAKLPRAANITLHDYYMDDLLSGCESEDEAIKIYDEMNELMNSGGFEIQKWSSNSDKLLGHIQASKKSTDQSVLIKSNNMAKVLGISWNKSTDNFEYHINLPDVNQPITKRSVLSDIARLYDPMGWIAPVVIVAKVFIQKLWKSGLNWDDQLTGDLLQQWVTFKNDLVNTKNIIIPRWLGTKKGWQVELHAFADASSVAYAAAVYIKTTDQDGRIHISLLTAKTKVAPVEKEVSIPRLELCAALLAAKLLSEVSQVLNVPKENLRAWTDSTVVLAWLKGLPNRWTTFVSNRVSGILTIMNFDQWSHVQTEHNPADCASRGLQPTQLADFSLWWNGPDWLYQSSHGISEINFETHEEERSIKALTATIVEDDFEAEWTRFSSLSKALRVMSYCKRMINAKYKKEERVKFSKHVSTKELDETLKIFVKQTQLFYFKEEIAQLKSQKSVSKRSPLHTLNSFLDQEGILRVGGRINQASLAFDKKHPMIIPSSSHLTRLIVSDAHQRTLHGGPQVMLNYLRSKFWIIRGRDQVKKCYRQCVTCLRYAKPPANQLMGQLPEVRLRPDKAFSSSGVDYAGPINIRFSPGRGSKSYKGYICLFICMSTRAIHLEAVSDLTSQGFIAAFRRFVSRRGHCRNLYSDNGTNFVGADKQLREMFKNAQSEFSKELSPLLSLENTDWHFIPPGAPNFGGLWEAGVRSTKSHLRKVIGDSTLTYEELSTVLAQIEACLNSRPITNLNENPDDPVPLTPGHFLVGEPLINIADDDHLTRNITSLERWHLVQKMVADFWKRWSREYLVTLNQRYKWTKRQPEPDIDDIVIVRDENLPPAKWLLGRVIQKHVGGDGITRVVTIICKNKVLKRPCNKLSLLPKN